MKIVEYAPYVLGFLIVVSLVMLIADVTFAGPQGGTLQAKAGKPATAAIEVHAVQVMTQNDAIGTRDYSLDSKASPSLGAKN